MDKIPWNRAILDEYLSLALLTPEEEEIVRTRAAGWSQTKQCHALHISLATLNRSIKKLKTDYPSLTVYSKILPKNLDF